MAAINAKERQEIKEYIEHTGKYESQTKYLLDEPVRVINVNNVEYIICEDMFSILDNEEYEDELFEFCSLLTSVENPQIFIVNNEQQLCVRVEDVAIILTQFMPPESKPKVLKKWYEIIDSLQELIEQNIE